MIKKSKFEITTDKHRLKWQKQNKRKKKPKNKVYWFDEELVSLKISNNYSDFLKSKYWKWIKGIVLKRDGYKCTCCESTTRLEIHHTTYKNHFNEHEHLEDLLTACHNCHHQFHLCCEVHK